jgi:hypothetical protein
MAKEQKLRKDALTIIRTTYRNNIELTNIADNKANILLSLNALMLTFLIPIVLSNLDVIVEQSLQLPLATLATTCLTTIIMAALSTRPIKMGQQQLKVGNTSKMSPFFFGNFYKMNAHDYTAILEQTINDPDELIQHIKQDLYFMGKGLGEKYAKIRRCYNIFMGGILVTIIAILMTLIVR